MPVVAAGYGIYKGLGGKDPSIGTPGNNNFHSSDYSQNPNYNPNDFQYGGYAGAADKAAGNYANEAGNLNGQEQNLYGFGAGSLDQSQQARTGQSTVADEMLRRAQGNDLISTKLADQERRGLVAEETSNAASARGPGGVALANQNAAAAGAQGLANIGGKEQIAGAQEKLSNLQGAGAAYGAMRGQDIGAAGTSFSGMGTAGNLGLGYSGLENKVHEDQLGASLHKQDVLSGGFNQGQQLQAGVSTANAANEWKPWEMALGAGQGAGQLGVAASDPEAKTDIQDTDGQPTVESNEADQDRDPDVVSGLHSQFDQPKKAKGKKDPMAILGSPSWLPKNFSAPNAHMMKALQLPEVSDPAAKSLMEPLGIGDVANDAVGPLSGGIFEGLLGKHVDPSGNAQLHEMMSSPGGDYKLGKGGGLDVKGTFAAMNQHVKDAINHPAGEQYASDPDAKNQIMALYEPEGMQLHMSPEGHAGFKTVDTTTTASKGASISGPAPKYTKSAVAEETRPKPAPKAERKMTPEEMSREADRMLSHIQAQRAALATNGPAVRRLESGSPETRYETQLTEGAKAPYAAWKERVAPGDDGRDYDYSGAFAAGADRDASGHMPDTYKKPGHPTFSNESQYAGDAPHLAGHWNGETYAPGQAPNVPPAWLDRYMAEDHASDPQAKDGVRDEGEIDDTSKMGFVDRVANKIVKASGVDTSPEARARRGEKVRQVLGAVEHAADRAKPVIAKITEPLKAPAEAAHVINHEETPQEKQIRENRYMIDALQRAKAQTEIDADRKRLATAGVPNASDPRGKVLGGVHDNEIAETLDETPAVSYKYKSDYFEPEAQHPGERQAGFLTTDLKKTPLGASVVEKRPDGYEGYNTHRMIGLEFAGLRNVHERLRDLEAIIAEKHRGGRKAG